MTSAAKQVDPRDLFVSINPTGLPEDELLKGHSGFVDDRTHSDYLIFLAGFNAGAVDGQGNEVGRHRPLEAEGCKPEINIQPSGSITAASPPVHDLDKAEGVQPDLDFQALPLAVRDLLAERLRQIQEEGHTPERDDQYTHGQLADAASTYAFWADTRGAAPEAHIRYLVEQKIGLWPWGQELWKPTNQRQMLIKAGALILAELERLDRKAVQEVRHES